MHCASCVLVDSKKAIDQEQTLRVAVDLPVSLIARIDLLKSQLGFKRRGDVVTCLLHEILGGQETRSVDDL
jgi:metal-responsive CopG/Arc/MetJ family transcriptional regulator